jgi:hypothetical protein
MVTICNHEIRVIICKQINAFDSETAREVREAMQEFVLA